MRSSEFGGQGNAVKFSSFSLNHSCVTQAIYCVLLKDATVIVEVCCYEEVYLLMNIGTLQLQKCMHNKD